MVAVRCGSRLASGWMLGASGLALAVSSPAWADCSPKPTQAYGTVTCTGTDAAGLLVDTQQTTVNVSTGANVSTIVATTPVAAGNTYPVGNTITVNVDGAISNGLTVNSATLAPGAAPAYGPTTSVALTVGSGGSVGGSNPIVLTANSSYPYNFATISIVNSGSIRASGGGAAVIGSPSGQTGITSLTNNAGGTIGAIWVPVGTLNNAGTIDGGILAALRYDLGAVYPVYPQSLTNSATITSSATDATVIGNTVPQITNSGTIANTGSGGAIRSTSTYPTLIVTNQAGGMISAPNGYAIASAGAVSLTNDGVVSSGPGAISSDGVISLINRGTITGDVVSRAPAAPGWQGSLIDTTHGTINGSVLLGASDDKVAVAYTPGANPFAAISGTVDAGGGTNTLQLNLTGSATLSAPLPTPASFQKTILGLADQSTVTLAQGFSTGGATLQLAAAGNNYYGTSATLDNQASFGTLGPILTAPYGLSLAFKNEGALAATLANPTDTALFIPYNGSFNNAGTITAIGGNGVNVSSGQAATNSGTITADGTALSVFDGLVTNSGTLVSNGGTALYLLGNVGSPASNTGTITGAKVGAQIDGYTLTNSGTISSSGGVGVSLDPYATLINLAGGVVNNGISPTLYGYTFNATVRNAGTINGNVSFGSVPFAGNNTYVALDGGVLNGNLDLGSGGTFATSLANSGSGLFSGVTGTVTGGSGSILRYLVTANATSSLASVPSFFSTVIYDLSNNAALTLSAPSAVPQALGFAGTGSVDFTGNLSGNGSAPLLNLTYSSLQTAGTPPQTVPTQLSLISRGTITDTVAAGSPYGAQPAVQAGGSSFTNQGTITFDATALAPTYGPSASSAIAGTGTIINNGTINVGNASAISGGYYGSGPNVTNAGSILQIAGAPDAIGVNLAGSLVNTGTISTGGSAAVLGYSYGSPGLTNSGTLTSAHDVAVRSAYYYGGAYAINQAGGTITGGAGFDAIDLAPGSTLDNAGTINGNVNLATNDYGYAPGSTYIARGGTISGNLSFGSGNDTLVVIGNSIGVSGTVDGGAGTDTYAQGFTASTTIDPTASVSLPFNFENYAIGAIGHDVTVTLSNPAAPLSALTLFGNGTIVNNADVAHQTNVYAGPNTVQINPYALSLVTPDGLNFTNNANLADGVSGVVRGFTNTGTIGRTDSSGPVASLYAQATGPFSFANSGTIQNGSSGFFIGSAVTIQTTRAAAGAPTITTATLDNSGTIAGGINTYLFANDLEFSNEGTISPSPSPYGGLPAVQLAQAWNAGSPLNARFGFANTGTISGGVALSSGAKALVFTNGSVIDSWVNIDHTAWSSTPTPLDSDSITNSGTITGHNAGDALWLNTHAQAVSFTNSGTITTQAASATGIYAAAVGTRAVTIAAANTASTAVSITNSGTLENQAIGGNALVIGALAGIDPSTSATAPGGNASITLTNSGTIRADGGALLNTVTPCCFVSTPAVPTLILKTGLGAFAAGTGTSSVSITNAAGGLIEANGALLQGDNTPYGPFTGSHPPVPGAPTGLGSIALAASAAAVNIVNAGTITGGAGGTIDPATAIDAGITAPNGAPLDISVLFPDRFVAGAIQTFASADTVTNTGTINGSVDLGAGDDSFTNSGAITGNVYLRSGNDTFTQNLLNQARLNGTVDGGTGTNTLVIDATGANGQAFNFAPFVNFQTLTVSGTGPADQVGLSGAVAFPTINLANAGVSVAAGQTLSTSGPTTITGISGNNSIANAGTIAGNIVLGGGNDQVSGSGSFTGAIAFGDGNNTLNLGTGGSIAGALSFGAGNDSVTNAGTIATTVALGAGNNTLANTATGVLQAGVSAGGGNDTVTNDGTITGTVALGDGANTFINHGQLNGSYLGGAGVDTVTNSGTITGNLALGDGNDVVTNTGTIGGNVDLGAGTNTFVNAGAITGTLNLGPGNDTYILRTGGTVNAVSGGGGSNTLVLQLTGTDAAPDHLDFTPYTNFQTLRQDSGVGAIYGNATFDAINIVGGRLIGKGGSVITAPTITVAAGATFGSAGTVIGNIVNNGVISPGASPGTMTVTGNVTFAPGSSAYYELTPTVSDKLVVTGTITIGANTTLNLTGTRPLVPGAPLDLLTATGGISGSFATINKPASVFGFVRQQANAIQLFGLFAPNPAFSPQVSRAVDYINATLQSGQASAALLAAVPGLADASGASIAARFAQLHPEAYASATQLGFDNGLAITSLARTLGADRRGWFGFGAGLGSWQTLAADAASGTARASDSSSGFLGGIGWRGDALTVGVFGGRAYARQNVSALDARTSGAGTFVGGMVGYAVGPVSLGGSLVWDGSSADTRRTLFTGETALGHYDLHSLSADVHLGYRMALGKSGWRFGPELGATYIKVDRGAALETGSGAFALAVAARSEKAGFLSGDLRLESPAAAAFRLRLEAGLRHRIGGDATLASAALIGTTGQLSVPGAERARDYARVGLGFDWSLTKSLTVFENAAAAFASNSNTTSVNVGVRLAF